jgi:hypothetical protein
MDNPDFDYLNLPLGSSSKIQIITAPNGYGKSTIFRLIRAIFKGNPKEISSIPFESAEVALDEAGQESILRVTKTHSEITMNEPGFTITFTQNDGLKREFQYPQDLSKLCFDDQKWMNKTANQLGAVIPPISLRFLSSERLFHDPLREIYQYDLLSEHNEDIFGENASRVRHDADSLAQRIDGVLTDYATTSHKIDVTFPADLLKRYPTADVDKQSPGNDELHREFLGIMEKRKQMEEIDFLPFRNWYPTEDNPFEIKDLWHTKSISYQDFLRLYLKEQKRKYEVFDWLNTRCQCFEEIINNLLIFTRIRIKRDKGFSFYNLYEGAGKYHEINLDQISSGEMHEVVMFFEFLFNCDPGTVVLIDEPEISLHVYAQSHFVDNIQKIADKKTNNLQFIIATHSPTIISDHWDITYDLLTGAYNE